MRPKCWQAPRKNANGAHGQLSFLAVPLLHHFASQCVELLPWVGNRQIDISGKYLSFLGVPSNTNLDIDVNRGWIFGSQLWVWAALKAWDEEAENQNMRRAIS